MCLSYVKPVPAQHNMGVGYKIVRHTLEPDVFIPLLFSTPAFSNSIKYQIGSWTRSRRTLLSSKIYAGNKARYIPGIHVYKWEALARKYYREIQSEYVCVIECLFKDAYAQDEEVFCVDAIKPLQVIASLWTL